MESLELTEKQEEIVKAKSSEMLIRGIAGSGKTIVLLRKAKQFAERNPTQKVIIFSYNTALTNSARKQIAHFNLSNLEVKTFHSWAYGLLSEIGQKPKVIDSKKAEKKIEELFYKNLPSSHRFSNGEKKYRDFIIDEIKWIKGMNIKTLNDYKSAIRTGRGKDIVISQNDRDIIFKVYEKYQRSKGNQKDFDDYAIELDRFKKYIPDEMKYSAIFVDEAQDLQMIQLKVLREFSKDIFIVAADKGQKIYSSSFTWKDIGLNIAGSRTKILDETFRSTKQIVELARSIQRNDSILSDEEFIETKLPNVEGAKPVWFKFKDEDTLIAGVIKLAKSLDLSNLTVGVLFSSNKVMYRFKKHLGDNGFFPQIIKKYEGDVHSPGLKLSTRHSAKGLEFDYVIIIATRDNTDNNLDLDLERRLYYVSMTRAKAVLYFFSDQSYSEVLDELDEKLYELKQMT